MGSKPSLVLFACSPEVVVGGGVPVAVHSHGAGASREGQARRPAWGGDCIMSLGLEPMLKVWGPYKDKPLRFSGLYPLLVASMAMLDWD